MTFLSACSGDSFVSSASSSSSSGGTAPGCSADPTCVVTAASVVATTDKPSITSDGFDAATITATVLDANRAAVKGAKVSFSTLSGKVSTGWAITDENGNATAKFSASADSPANGITLVTASVTGVGFYSVPITITGTKLVLSAKNGKSTLIITPTVNTKTLLVKATNSAGLGAFGASIAFTLAGSSDGSVAVPTGTLISPNPALTDITGTATVTLTGQTSGDVWITADGLGSSNPERQAQFFVQDQNAFRISSPTPVSGSQYVEMVTSAAGTLQAVTVNAGLSNVAVGSTVRFTSTVGSWSDGSNPGGTFTDFPFVANGPSTGTATATLRSATGNNGFATVYAFVLANPKHNDSIQVAMSPPITDAAQIIVHTDEKTLFPTTSTATFSTKVRVQVRTSLTGGNYPIANVPVSLQLQNATGGGESLTQGYGFTDVYGNFVTTLTSGVTSTGQIGVKIVATDAVNPAITSSATVEIGGVAGSVALGTPRFIELDDKNKSISTYIMSALVSDGTGAAVNGANVTLHFWPTEYYTGVWYKGFTPTGTETWFYDYTGSFKNEDVNENGILDGSEDLNCNGILDPGEDTNGNGILDLGEDVNGDCQLNPQSAYAGASPPIVTTGINGAAPFNYVYLKDAAGWVNVRAMGSTRVFGTEATTFTEFIPKNVKAEVDAGNVNNSPFRLWVFIRVGDATGTAVVPGTSTPWSASSNIVLSGAVQTYPGSDKGSFSGTTFKLPAGIGPYAVGDTETVTVSVQKTYGSGSTVAFQFPLSVRFIQ